MIRAFVADALPDVRKVQFLEATPASGSRLFQTIPSEEFAGIIEMVPSIAQADYVVAPHEYAVLKKNAAYFQALLDSAKSAGKRLIVSAYQDDNAPIRLPGAIVLRPGAYKSTLMPNEVIVPPYIEHIGKAYGFEPLPRGDAPHVGFAGKAGFASMRERARYFLRNYALVHGAERDGIFFRRNSLAGLARDKRIVLDAIIRRSFSANRKTVEVPPEVARREYIDNLRANLFTLAPRGDGNFSFRFFEALSAGRIPILIETDCALPLEDRIRYDDFILRVPISDMHRLGAVVHDFWDSRSNEDLMRMQRRAREAYDTYLYPPRFYSIVFTSEFLNAVPSL